MHHIYLLENEHMSISEQGMLVFVRLHLATALHIPSLGFQYHNTSVLTSGQIVLLQVFDPLHIRPLGFQYHDIRDLALVQFVVLRPSPPFISEETCLLLYEIFLHTFIKLFVKILVWKIGHYHIGGRILLSKLGLAYFPG